MQPLFHNRYVRFVGGAVLIILFLIVVAVALASLNSARSTSTGLSVSYDAAYAPGIPGQMGMGGAQANRVSMEAEMLDSYLVPTPTPGGGYTDSLESYETSQYSITARTKEFDALCATIENLKADPNIDFKYLTSSTNNCRATFYTDEERVNDVLNTLNVYEGVEVTRSTESVTRHREQIQSRTSILRQQLSSVERSLTIAETEFDRIASFAREQNDASTLSEAIREKLSLVDTLTQRKISLTSQLDSLLQQSADLETRMNVVEFTVTINRSYPIYPNQDSRKWEQAWETLDEQFTNTLIGLTAFFGVFLLWTVQIVIYLLVVILILRGLWKFFSLIRKKW